MLSLFFIMKRFDEIFHMGEFFKESKKLQQKDADRIIGLAPESIFMSDNGPYKRKIDEGNDKPRKAAGNASILMDLNVSTFEGVSGQPEFLRLWKRAIMFVTGFNANTVDFPGSTSKGKWRQVSQGNSLWFEEAIMA